MCNGLAYEFHWITFSHRQSEMDNSYWSVAMHGRYHVAGVRWGGARALLAVCLPGCCARKWGGHAHFYAREVSYKFIRVFCRWFNGFTALPFSKLRPHL